LIPVLAAVLVASAACGGGRHPDATPGAATTEAVPTTSATVVPSPTPLGFVAPLYPFFPPGTHTGVAEVDAIIDAAVGGDTALLRSRLVLSQVPCDQTRADYRRPPDCPPGVPAGTPIDVLPAGDCEGSFRRAADIDGALAAYVAAQPLLYGLALQPAANADEPDTYAAVFTTRKPTLPTVVISIRSGGVVGAASGCGESPPDWLHGLAGVGYGTAKGNHAVVGPPPWTIDRANRRTGIATVDAALTVLVTGDPKQVEPLVSLSMFRCTTEERRLGSPPACPEGVPNGTPVPEFMAARGCEGYFVPPALVGREVARALATLKALAAVYVHPGGPLLSPPNFPASDYEVLFEQFSGQAISFHLNGEGRLVLVAERCASTPAKVLSELNATDLLR